MNCANLLPTVKTVKLWNELRKLTTDCKNKQKELSDLRLKYELTENNAQRTVIAHQIIELENINLEMKKQLSIKTVQVKNAEVKFLIGK